MANFHHNNRNHGYRGRGRKNHNAENRDNQEIQENRPAHDQQEARAMYRERRERENRERDSREQRDNKERRDNRENHEVRNNREARENQTINVFTLGAKELEGKNAQFQYDKGWYSIIDIVGEEKNVVYKSKNAQEAYTKWNVYIGRKKERLQRAEKSEN